MALGVSRTTSTLKSPSVQSRVTVNESATRLRISVRSIPLLQRYSNKLPHGLVAGFQEIRLPPMRPSGLPYSATSCPELTAGLSQCERSCQRRCDSLICEEGFKARFVFFNHFFCRQLEGFNIISRRVINVITCNIQSSLNSKIAIL